MYLGKLFRKITLYFICLLTLIILSPISGCTKKEDAGKTLKFVTWKQDQPDVWEEVLRIFEQENSDIRIEQEVGPHSSTAYHDLLTQKLKNKSKDVDVFFMDVVWPAEFASAGWALPLDNYFTKDKQAKFIPATIMTNTYRGHIYGVPLFIGSGLLYYRRDLLEKYGFDPPETWSEMAAQAEEIVEKEATQGNEIYGFSAQFKQYEGLVCNMMEYIMSNGGAVIDEKTGKSAITEERAIEAVDFVRDNIIGKAAPGGALTYEEPESIDLFVQGKAVFHRNWAYAWEVSNNPSKSKISGKVGIARLPHFEGNRSYATLGGWELGISSFSDNKEIAWRFVEFLTSERIQKIFAINANAPTREAIYDDAEVLSANPHFREMKEVFLTAYPRPVTPLYPSVSNVLQRYFSTAISVTDTDIEKEADDASQEIDKILSITR